jgi:GNAT superfamily N-acetyltransferase
MDNVEVPGPTQKETEEKGSTITTRVYMPDKAKEIDFGSYTEQMYEMIADLYGVEQLDTLSRNAFAKENLTESDIHVLAFEDDRAIGFGTLEPPEDFDEEWRGWVGLGEAYVKKDHRQKGVYKMLTEERLKLAQELGAQYVITKILHPEQEFQIGYLKMLGFREVTDPSQTPFYKDRNLYSLDLKEWRKNNEAKISQG